MMRYQEALSRCLEAVAQGRDLEAVLASLPARHRDRLRGDATLAAAVRAHSATIPAPSAAAESNALSRLNAELAAQHAERRAAPSRSGGFFGVPRVAFAGLLLAAVLVGAAFVIGPNTGNDGTVEAADFEGVVVANAGDFLTVQTLNSLEEVMVPLDALVAEEDGAQLDLAAIEEGEVVHIRGDRRSDGPVHARDIRRRLNGLPGWCEENAERCRLIAQNLRDAQERCRANPEACRLLHDRVTDVISRVTDVADLEDLKARCRIAGGEDCRDIASFCREHADVCVRDLPPGPVIDRLDDVRERLHDLDTQCTDRDTQACRRIAQFCTDHPEACDEDAPLPLPPVRDRAPQTDALPSPAPSDAPATDNAPGTDQRPSR
jgi:hypothetical protein